MKIKQGLMLHKIGSECIVVSDGSAPVDFNHLLNLNPSAAWLWQQLEGKDFDAGLVAQLLLGHYAVTEELAAKDAEAFVERLRKAGVTE